MKLSALVIVSIMMSAATASAFQFPLPKTEFGIQRIPATFTSDYDFEGIVALNNCSGSLIQLENGKDTDKALILTNGHCLETGMPRPGTFVVNRASSRRFNVLDSDSSSLGQVTATAILYSTMTDTDMTIYKLKETYAEIKTKFHTRPFVLSSERPSEGTAIEVVSGYWKRGYTCQIEAFINTLKEDGWVMKDSIRYSRPGCEVIGGTSGSPIIEAGTRTVIGINNTGNESGQKCTMNNPCEVDANGKVTAVRGYTYGQQTYLLYTCLNAQNEIDVKVSGCQLPH